MDTECSCHKDEHNLIAGFGKYEGGELCVFKPSGDNIVAVRMPNQKPLRMLDGSQLRHGDLARANILPIHGEVQEFDGKSLPHQTQPFKLGDGEEGHRWVVIAFRVEGWRDMPKFLRIHLTCLGLNWLALPMLAHVIAKKAFSEDDVVLSVLFLLESIVRADCRKQGRYLPPTGTKQGSTFRSIWAFCVGPTWSLGGPMCVLV